MADSPLTRRRAVLLGAAGMVGACTGEERRAQPPTPSRTSPSPSSASPSPASSPSPVEALPSGAPWRLVRTEVEPEAKETAVRAVEAYAAWAPGQDGQAALRERLAALDVPARVADGAAGALPAAEEASVEVITAQYGGLQATRASVLVSYRQWLRRADGEVVEGGSSMDVRLTGGRSGWTVTGMFPARPGRPVRPPGELIGRVLGHTGVRLPSAAAADVRAGHMKPQAMRGLLALAERYEVDVSIVHTAHPRNVFGTDRLSDHTRMRAFDVWAVDGRRVVDAGTPAALIEGFMRRAVAAGAYNVGGPRLPSGGAYFSDRVHRDHVHVGFDRDG